MLQESDRKKPSIILQKNEPRAIQGVLKKGDIPIVFGSVDESKLFNFQNRVSESILNLHWGCSVVEIGYSPNQKFSLSVLIVYNNAEMHNDPGGYALEALANDNPEAVYIIHAILNPLAKEIFGADVSFAQNQ